MLVRTLATNHRGGDEIAAHAHDWHQLIYASAGLLNVWTERGSWIVPPHWAVWVPAGTRHSIRFTGAAELRTLYLRPGWALALPGECTAATVSSLLRELILRAVSTGMLDSRDPVEAALATLIADEFRQSPVPPFALPQPESEAVRKAVTLLADGAAEAADMGRLARAVGLGRRTLERRFLAETGMSPARWRQQARLLGALERLAGGQPVKAAAADAGYAAASAFVAAFRAQFGVTPARYFGRG